MRRFLCWLELGGDFGGAMVCRVLQYGDLCDVQWLINGSNSCNHLSSDTGNVLVRYSDP